MSLGVSFPVLLIEDEFIDAELLQEAVTACALPWTVRHVTDVQKGLLTLDTSRPALILTDRCLPGYTSAELLITLTADARIGGIPVVVLAGVMSAFDRQACLDGQAQAVLLKPTSFTGYLELVQDLHARWGCQSG